MSQWFFEVRDTVTAFLPEHQWLGKKVKVEKIGNGRLWGRVEDDDFSSLVNESRGLTLLGRPGLRFGVGDDIIVIKKKPNTNLKVGAIGKVIVVNPEPEAILPYFAEFDGSRCFLSPMFSGLFWSRPWFPDDYKTIHYNRVWIGERMVEEYS